MRSSKPQEDGFRRRCFRNPSWRPGWLCLRGADLAVCFPWPGLASCCKPRSITPKQPPDRLESSILARLVTRCVPDTRPKTRQLQVPSCSSRTLRGGVGHRCLQYFSTTVEDSRDSCPRREPCLNPAYREQHQAIWSHTQPHPTKQTRPDPCKSPAQNRSISLNFLVGATGFVPSSRRKPRDA
jgi:hypothetical protein